MRSLLIIVFMLFGLAYCGAQQSDSNTVQNDSSFRVAIWESLPLKIQRLSENDDLIADQWNEYFGTEIIQFVDDDYDCRTQFDDYIEAYNAGEVIMGRTLLRYDETQQVETCTIQIKTGVGEASNKQEYINILSHEIGHALGADHASTGLMKSNVNYYESLNQLFNGEFSDLINENYIGVTNE